MKTSSKAIAAAVALSLSCVSPAALAQSNAISPGYLTGTWKDNAQCRGNESLIFFPNNTMSSAGSVPINYAVTGPSQFTMHGPGGAVPIQAQYVNQNQMVVTFNNDAGVFYRCGGANAAGAGNAQLTSAYMVGGWGHNGNCRAPEVFQAGGRFRSSQNHDGSWSLLGNTLRLVLNNGNGLDFTVHPNGNQNMTLTQVSNGDVSQYTRCF